jgi:organic hydroperoxide reductase OsmC/OhrA
VAPFVDRRYSRAHTWRFDGGLEVPASSSPAIVPLPFSDPAGVDPEEAFVASLSSCHLLWFLDLAARAGLAVDRYEDDARGTLGKNAEGKLAMLEVVLRPRVQCTVPPSREQLLALHHAAHEACFLANSVKTVVRVEPAD